MQTIKQRQTLSRAQRYAPGDTVRFPYGQTGKILAKAANGKYLIERSDGVKGNFLTSQFTRAI